MPSSKIISNTKSNINLSSTPYASLTKLIPSVVNQTLTFDIIDGNPAIANAIRRTLMSEIPIRHLTVSLSDIKTTDPYIIGEAIKKRIEMIPISQDTDMDTVFAVKFENNTDEYIDVSSSEIKINGMSQSNDIMPNIPICDINSDTMITINDIHVSESFGYNNSRVSIGRVGYEILDVDFNQPSLQSSPTHFRIEVETCGIHDPLKLVHFAIDTLIQRLDAIDYSKHIVEFDIYKLTIENESYTISKMLSWYIYQLNKNIKYVASRVPHPSKRECVIDIHHPAGGDICKKAAMAIKNDLLQIRKTMK